MIICALGLPSKPFAFSFKAIAATNSSLAAASAALQASNLWSSICSSSFLLFRRRRCHGCCEYNSLKSSYALLLPISYEHGPAKTPTLVVDEEGGGQTKFSGCYNAAVAVSMLHGGTEKHRISFRCSAAVVVVVAQDAWFLANALLSQRRRRDKYLPGMRNAAADMTRTLAI